MVEARKFERKKKPATWRGKKTEWGRKLDRHISEKTIFTKLEKMGRDYQTPIREHHKALIEHLHEITGMPKTGTSFRNASERIIKSGGFEEHFHPHEKPPLLTERVVRIIKPTKTEMRGMGAERGVASKIEEKHEFLLMNLEKILWDDYTSIYQELPTTKKEINRIRGKLWKIGDKAGYNSEFVKRELHNIETTKKGDRLLKEIFNYERYTNEDLKTVRWVMNPEKMRGDKTREIKKLIEKKGEITISKIVEKVDYPWGNVYRALEKLEKQGEVKCKKIGKKRVYFVPEKN